MVKKIFYILFLVIPSALFAQDKVAFYPEMCDLLQAVFCDYASREGEVKYLSGRDGQYIGNFINYKIYGWDTSLPIMVPRHSANSATANIYSA